jgi:hypothetical protein
MKLLIRFIKDANTEYGRFEKGDILRCSAETAKQFIECGLAVYER